MAVSQNLEAVRWKCYIAHQPKECNSSFDYFESFAELPVGRNVADNLQFIDIEDADLAQVLEVHRDETPTAIHIEIIHRIGKPNLVTTANDFRRFNFRKKYAVQVLSD